MISMWNSIPFKLEQNQVFISENMIMTKYLFLNVFETNYLNLKYNFVRLKKKFNPMYFSTKSIKMVTEVKLLTRNFTSKGKLTSLLNPDTSWKSQSMNTILNKLDVET